MKTIRYMVAVVGLCAVNLLVQPDVSFAVNECCTVGGSCYSSSGFPYAAATICPSGNTCGCTIYGTNCQVRLAAGVSTSSGSDCLTIGKGVTLDMNNQTFNCSGSDCGRAITTTPFHGTGNSEVSNGFITGCWDIGVYGTSGLTTTVDNMSVTLGRSCTNGLNISGTLRNVGLLTGNDITNSQVHDTEWGMFTTGDISAVALTGNAVGIESAGGNVTGAFFDGNDVQIEENSGGGSNINVSTATFAHAVSCNRAIAGSCQSDIDGGAVNLTGTDPIIVCDPSGDATRICTFR